MRAARPCVGFSKGLEAAKLAALSTRYAALLAMLRAECSAAEAHEQSLELLGSHLANQETLLPADRKDAGSLGMLAALANEVVALIAQPALAAAYGTAIDKDDKAQAKQRKKDDAQKKALVAALHTKAVALADVHALALEGSAGGAGGAAETLAALDAAVAALHKWAAATEHVKLTCRWHVAHGRLATALGVLSESVSKEKKAPSKDDLELKAELLEKLGWAHWATATKAQLHAQFPSSLPLVFKPL